MKKTITICSILLLILTACSNKEPEKSTLPEITIEALKPPFVDQSPNEFKILALGDSYTIGERVCATCRFPEQLKDSLINNYTDQSFSLNVIAKTGWTTTDLKRAINTQNPATDNDLVTLLIGVNNQFQELSFFDYKVEFQQLVQTAVKHAQGNKNKVIVVSIPDYAFTPFGNGNAAISRDIDAYNDFAENFCLRNAIAYVYITDITRQGLIDPELVAPDRLHPSTKAYTKFVERLLPLVKIQLD